MDALDDNYSPEETARRRDEVIRRMANTPPQPKPAPNRRPKKETPVAGDQDARAGRPAL